MNLLENKCVETDNTGVANLSLVTGVANDKRAEKSLQFGVQHIEDKIELLMQEEVAVSKYLDDVTHTYSQIANISEMTANINDDFKNFSSYANQISEIIDRSDTMISRTESNVSELSENINATNTQLDNIASVFSRLEADFANIRNMSNGINNIAMQSKLLAFNASIEAERAGAEGRAFGVVAQQMRLLSTSTKDLVDGIDESVKALVKSINDVNAEIQASKATSLINLQKVNDVKNNTSEVNECTVEVKNFSKQIIQGIDNTSARINGAAEGFGAISQVVDSFGEKIENLNVKMSKKSSIICSVIDFLQQMENILDEMVEK